MLSVRKRTIAGCTGTVWPFQEKPKPNTAGVLSPPEQIAMLRELGKQAPASTAEQAQRTSELLAAMLPKERDALIRVEVVRALQKYQTPTASAAIVSAMKDQETDVRVAACEALGRRGGPESVTVLVGALRGDVDVDVRLAAARALGQSHDPAAIQALGGALDDKDPAMQYRAVLSLKSATGKDFGNDVKLWQQYVKGEMPDTAPSLADRMRNMF
jgi:HEAT repeat protein